ncbi:hypothetical protein ACA910_021646 [Epithemia clementina (nom. ined.)]
MLAEDVLKLMEEDLANLESVFQEMIEEFGTIREKLQILCTENPRVAKKSSKNNSSSIHFALTNHTPGSIRSEYNEKITNDLELCGMDAMGGTLKEQQSRLRVRLIEEWSYVQLKQSVKLGQERSAKAMFVLLNTVPCILNAENRMGIKITETLLIEGLSNAMKEAKRGEKASTLDLSRRSRKKLTSRCLGMKSTKLNGDVQCPMIRKALQQSRWTT